MCIRDSHYGSDSSRTDLQKTTEQAVTAGTVGDEKEKRYCANCFTADGGCFLRRVSYSRELSEDENAYADGAGLSKNDI